MIAAAYDDADAAVADYEAVKALYRAVRTSHDFDAAVIAKDEDGKVQHRQEARAADPPRRRRRARLGPGRRCRRRPVPARRHRHSRAGAGGAAIGGVAGHASGGMSRGDLKELGEALDTGQAGLIAVYETNLADQVAANIKAANRIVSRATDMAADQLAADMKAEASAQAQQAATSSTEAAASPPPPR